MLARSGPQLEEQITLALGLARSDIERTWLIRVREDHGIAGDEFSMSDDERQRLRDILSRGDSHGRRA